MLSLKLLLSLSIVLSAAIAHYETCEEEIARENAEDWKNHACRSCKEIEVNAPQNCPPMGFDCDPQLHMSSSALSTDSCECSQIRCADSNATLAVEGQLVFKVTCSEQKWTISENNTAASAVCARKCGVGVCSILPSEFFRNNPTLLPFKVNPPDEEHPCAWGTCSDGAIAVNSNTLSEEVTFEGEVEFSCSGFCTWMLPGGNRYKHVACKQKICKSLPVEKSAVFCGIEPEDQYSCYDPTFENDGTSVKKMTCDDPNDLRLSSNNQELSPVCSFGQWTNDGSPIDKNTKVMCLTCPIAQLAKDLTVEPPTMIKHQKEVTCPTVDFLTIGLYRPGDEGPAFTFIKVKSIICTNLMQWEASLEWPTAGGKFTEFKSLSEAVKDGVSFAVFCFDKFPENP